MRFARPRAAAALLLLAVAAQLLGPAVPLPQGAFACPRRTSTAGLGCPGGTGLRHCDATQSGGPGPLTAKVPALRRDGPGCRLAEPP